jgi:hypothetical protein
MLLKNQLQNVEALARITVAAARIIQKGTFYPIVAVVGGQTAGFSRIDPSPA